MSTVNPGKTLTLQAAVPSNWTVADLQSQLGGISAERIRLYPPPGCATEQDVIAIEDSEDRLYELENGTLVEKGMGWYESLVALIIAGELRSYLANNDLGKLLGADGSLRLLPNVVKIPDISFISWERWPKSLPPRGRIPSIVPDLVVEILSESNTTAEMDAKLRTYFIAGVRLVWYVDPVARTARVYFDETTAVEVGPDQSIDGGDVLPRFELALRRVFEEADRQAPE